MTNRAYSVLTIKAVDAQSRTISGMATTPETDRVGDIIDPLGASFSDELPLLWQHEHGKPIGTAKFGKATKAGIPFTATIHDEAEPGPLKELVDMAWQSIKAKLVRGVSIGFRALEYNFMKEGGIHFTKTEIYELSAVTIPANAGATITSIKSIDAGIRAAVGLVDRDDERPRPASQELPVVKSIPARTEDMTTKTIGEQIADFENTRRIKHGKMKELADKGGAEGLTLDPTDADAFDTIQKEVEAIDGHLKRLRVVEQGEASNAKATNYQATQTQVQQHAQTGTEIRVATQKAKDPGIRYAQFARSMVLGRVMNVDPERIVKQLYGDDQGVVGMVQKAAVAAANTLNDTWAGNLVSDEGGVAADFVEFLRPQTIVGRIPNLRRVPFRVPLIGQTSGGSGYWVGEGKPKPLTKFDFNRTTLLPLKVANIAVATKELLRDSSPSADLLIRDSLAAALRERIDIDFIDPTKTAVANISPASILNGITGIPATGTGTADDVRCDIQALFAAFIAANNPPSSGVWIMPTTTALALSLMQNPLGQTEFPGIGMTGGTFFGMPVVVSDYVPTDTAGAVVALVNASDIWFADDGGISIDVSTEAALQMDNAPTNASVSGAGNDTVVATSMVSLWQTNSVGFLAERTLNWARRRESAVAYLTGVNWGAC